MNYVFFLVISSQFAIYILSFHRLPSGNMPFYIFKNITAICIYVFINFMCYGSPEKWKPHVCPIYKETYYEEVAHMIIKTEKSKDL